MAHTGKFYRLHFRRDLGIDTRINAESYAKEYLVQLGDAKGTVGSNLAGRRIKCSAVDELTFIGAKWQSEWFVSNGHMVRYVLETSEATGWPDITTRLSIFDQTVGLLVAINATRVPRLPLGRIDGADIFTPPTHPPLLDKLGSRMSFLATFVGYT